MLPLMGASAVHGPRIGDGFPSLFLRRPKRLLLLAWLPTCFYDFVGARQGEGHWPRAHCRPLSPEVKHVADGTVLEDPRRDFDCRVTTVERSQQLVLDPGDRFRGHVMDGPGQD